jgi:hypothetical protein
LADHLLDGPHDNLSVLTTHIHRKQTLYTAPEDQSTNESFSTLLITQDRSEWIRNRLEIMHRLRLLNAYLGALSAEFASLVSPNNSSGNRTSNRSTTDAKELLRAWAPASSRLGRCWSCNKRDNNQRNVIERPTWLGDTDPTGSMNNARWTLLSTVWHTSPDLQAKEAWRSRYVHLRRQLVAEARGRAEIDIIPPDTCSCESCLQFWASRLCARATRHAASRQLAAPEERASGYTPSHPDYVPRDQLLACLRMLGPKYKVVTEFLKQLTRTPEYLGYEESTNLQVEMFPDVYQAYLFSSAFRPRLDGEAPPFLEWLGALHRGEIDD